MNKFVGWLTLTMMVVLAGAASVVAQLKVQPDKENVVASRLEGEWESDKELNQRLGGATDDVFSFKSQREAAAKLPEILKGKQIYMAGVMTLRGKEYPFVLIENRGNPHVVYFRERGGNPVGDAESFNVMLAVAEEKQNDVLLIGGDFNNQPFEAFRRVKVAAK